MTYSVLIRAADKDGRVGEFSNIEQFVWPAGGTEEPVPPLDANDVTWPARPLPDVSNAGYAGRVVATQLWLNSEFRGVGTRIGEFVMPGIHCMDGGTNDPFFVTGLNPLHHIYRNDNNPSESLMSFALYRYQVTNTTLEYASADVVRVSPLMEHIAYAEVWSQRFSMWGSAIRDRFIAVLPDGDPGDPTPCLGPLPDLRPGYEGGSPCPGAEPVTISQFPPPGTVLPVGTHPVRITAEDRYGVQNFIITEETIFPPLAGNGPAYLRPLCSGYPAGHTGRELSISSGPF